MKSIKFNTPMIRAVLDGLKTVTRRPVKPQPPARTSNGTPYTGFQKTTLPCSEGFDLTAYIDNPLYIGDCPFGKVGDKLYVQETFYPSMTTSGKIIYKADFVSKKTADYFVWKPSVHMTQELSRITLEITNIRVERIQDMREGDVISEGINAPEMIRTPGESVKLWADFKELWDSIYEEKGFEWEINPFVWVLEFKAENK